MDGKLVDAEAYDDDDDKSLVSGELGNADAPQDDMTKFIAEKVTSEADQDMNRGVELSKGRNLIKEEESVSDSPLRNTNRDLDASSRSAYLPEPYPTTTTFDGDRILSKPLRPPCFTLTPPTVVEPAASARSITCTDAALHRRRSPLFDASLLPQIPRRSRFDTTTPTHTYRQADPSRSDSATICAQHQNQRSSHLPRASASINPSPSLSHRIMNHYALNGPTR
ncbi:hypothetical protein RYX36_035676 [Vicia faba]